MKSGKNLLEQLKTLSYFTKEVLYQLGDQYGLTRASLDTYVSRFLKRREIIALKRGVYVSTDFYDKNKGDISYSFYLANILRTPSYVSSWTALQYYNLTTEAIHTVTSVIPQITRDYETKAGNYRYQSIKKDLFSDFVSVDGKFAFFIATPAKALFDLLYFKTHQFRAVTTEGIEGLVKELRVDIEEMKEAERTKFYEMVKKYINHE